MEANVPTDLATRNKGIAQLNNMKHLNVSPVFEVKMNTSWHFKVPANRPNTHG